MMEALAYIPVLSRLWPKATLESGHKGEVEQRLELAMEQRRRMEVTFLNPEMTDLDFSGPCFRVGDDSMFIDAPYNSRYSECAGAAVKVCFDLESSNITTFFQFTSKIQGFKSASGVALELPAELSSNQRRGFLRIAPSLNTVLQVNVWPIEDEDLSQVSSIAEERKGFHSGKANAEVVNISAAGLCIQTQNDPGNPVVCYEKDSRLLVFLRLKKPRNLKSWPPAFVKVRKSGAQSSNANTLDLWLVGTVRYCKEVARLADVLLGFNFIMWGVPESEKSPLVWSTTGDDGEIPLLADWVWQHHVTHSVSRRF